MIITSGIEGLDELLLPEGLPPGGCIAISGETSSYQTAIAKQIAKNASKDLKGIAVSTQFGQWTTKDIAQEAPNLLIMETENLFDELKKVTLCGNLQEFPLLVIDSVPCRGGIFALQAIKKFQKAYQGLLIFVFSASEKNGTYDLELTIRKSAGIILVLDEKKIGNETTVNLKIFGKLIEAKKYNTGKDFNPEKPKEGAD